MNNDNEQQTRTYNEQNKYSIYVSERSQRKCVCVRAT